VFFFGLFFKMDPRNPTVVFVCGVSVATILAVAATSELFTVPTHVRPRLSTQTAQPPLVLHQRGFAEVASSTLSPVAVPIPAQKAVLPAFVLTVSAGISAVAAFVLRTSQKSHADVESLPLALAAATGSKERPVWFPGATAPEWLTGEYPGDRGFDPFGLARDPKDFAKYRDAEVLHGRWAMLGLVGCLMPEVLGNLGVAKLPAWYEVGGTVYGGSIDYLGNPEWIHAGNASVILLTTLLFMGPVEAWRWNGAVSSEAKASERTTYPGGAFDPLKLGASPERKLKEIKNGRLAMTAMAGFWAQSYYTGQGPLANLAAHLANPFGANITSSVAMF